MVGLYLTIPKIRLTNDKNDYIHWPSHLVIGPHLVFVTYCFRVAQGFWHYLVSRASIDSSLNKKKTCDVSKRQNLCFPWKRGTTTIGLCIFSRGGNHYVLDNGQTIPVLYNLVGTFHHKRSLLLKTGFFRQAKELKIQRKIPGSVLCVIMDDVNLSNLWNFICKRRKKCLQMLTHYTSYLRGK